MALTVLPPPPMSPVTAPQIGILTVSDRCSRGEAADTSGPAIEACSARAAIIEIKQHD